MGAYLLNLLRDDAAGLGDSDLPSAEETRAVVAALVRRVESLELYLAEQTSGDTSARPPGPASEPAAPVEPPPPPVESVPSQPVTEGQAAAPAAFNPGDVSS